MVSTKKKGKKQSKGKTAVEEEVTEYDNMDLEMLKEVVPMLKQQLEKSMRDRNYVQIERDTIRSFYEISKKESQELDAKISLKERALEIMEDNHRVEKKVYMQKVKYLQYDQKNKLRLIEAEENRLMISERDLHRMQIGDLKKMRDSIRNELAAAKVGNSVKLKEIEERNIEVLNMLREELETKGLNLQSAFQRRLKELKEFLLSKKKMELFELEERKNFHIHTINENHEKSFEQSREYFNGITTENLEHIASMKEELEEMKLKETRNQQLIVEKSEEYRLLEEPFFSMKTEISSLKEKMKGREGDLFNLKNTRLRLMNTKHEIEELKLQNENLQLDISNIDKSKTQLEYDFGSRMEIIRKKRKSAADILEQRILALQESIRVHSEDCKADFEETGLLTADQLTSLRLIFKEKSSENRKLQKQYIIAVKSYEDAKRTYKNKLEKMGVGPHELDSLKLIPTKVNSYTGPAGLVTK